jgi:hypothetical protein
VRKGRETKKQRVVMTQSIDLASVEQLGWRIQPVRGRESEASDPEAGGGYQTTARPGTPPAILKLWLS